MNLDKEHITRAFFIALFVGTVLNIINQVDVMIEDGWHSLDLFKIILTYLVPFVVSVYTAIKIKEKE